MNKFWKRGMLACASILLGSVTGYSQGLTNHPIDISDYFNVDGFMVDADDTAMADTLGLDDAGARVQSETLPEAYTLGEPLLSADQTVSFLLGPAMEPQTLDAYRPQGQLIDVEDMEYSSLYMAMISGNGEFPGATWADSDTMTMNYADGTSEDVEIGVVNDWFWTPPTWLTPASGEPEDVIVDLTLHDSDPNEIEFLWNWTDLDGQSHDFGKYRYADGPDAFLTYLLPYEEGADLYLRAWGNIKVSISTEDVFPLDGETTEVYNSVTEHGTVFPGGGDGYFPPEQESDDAKLITIDLSEYLAEGTEEFFVHFTDAAPGEATGVDSGNWGARVNRIGVFQGEVEESSLGDRIWPGLVRSDGAAPTGGLQLIRKGYRLEEGKVLESIQMPDLFPNASPYLTIFGMTLVEGTVTSVEDFMLY